MIRDARNSSRRWTMVTEDAMRARKLASSMAESPPPTTTIGLSRKKNPSQVAQVETPKPRRRLSLGRSSQRAEAPVEMMTLLARCSSSPTQTRKGRSDRSTRDTSAASKVAPKRSAWARMCCISSGPVTPSGKPGKFSTSVVSINCPPAPKPSMMKGDRLARAA